MKYVDYPDASEVVDILGSDAHGVPFLIERHVGRVVHFYYSVASVVDECESLVKGVISV